MCDGNSNRMAVVSDFQEDSERDFPDGPESGPRLTAGRKPTTWWGAQALHTTRCGLRIFYLKGRRAIPKIFVQ